MSSGLLERQDLSCIYPAHHELGSVFIVFINVTVIFTSIITVIITNIIIKLSLLAQHRPFDDAGSFCSYNFALTVTVLPSLSLFCPHCHGVALTVTVLPSLSWFCPHRHGFVLTLTMLPSLSRFCLHRHTFALTVTMTAESMCIGNPTSGTTMMSPKDKKCKLTD